MEQTSDTISKMPYMKKKHDEIKENLITQKKGEKDCLTVQLCHQNAQKGVFSDDDVKIPNYGKWNKDKRN